ncbi:MAG: hypothetical protein GY757_27760 [bacterium]|nr:hypothetical protein [bacterium]
MLGSEVLELITGLAFVYLLCSLAGSAIHDWLAGLLNTKATALEKRLAELLESSNLVEEIYNHPLIKGTTYKSLYDRLLFRKKSTPKYIAPNIFSSVLVDLIEEKGFDIDSLYKGFKETPGDKNVLKSLVKKVEARVTEKTNRVEAEAEKLKANIENWFNDSMSQMSKWYKQRTRFIIFCISLILCGALNVDTIMISKALYQDDAIRQAIVEVAGQTTAQTPAQETGKKKTPMEKAKELEVKLSELGLPIGWSNTNEEKDIKGYPTDFLGWLLKILGILMSTVATSMGAPFWFDVIRKMMRLKGKKVKE